MTGLPTLDPEIADLGLALGLLSSSNGGVELDSSWFDNPGARLTGTLGDDARRSALVRFVDAVLAQGEHDENDGVTYLHLFNLRELANDSSLPDLTVQATLDARPIAYVEVGIAAALTTTAPDTSTQVAIPLYRAAKTNQSVAQPFALLAGGVIHVGAELTFDTTPPATDEFGLAGVEAAIDAALVGGPPPPSGSCSRGCTSRAPRPRATSPSAVRAWRSRTPCCRSCSGWCARAPTRLPVRRPTRYRPP